MQAIILFVLVFVGVACRGQDSEPVKLSAKPVNVGVPLAAGLAASEHFELRLNNIHGASGAAVILRIFAETPHADRDTSVDDPGFLGNVTVLPTGDAKRQPVSAIISVPGRRVPDNARKLQVTIVPVTGTELQIGSIQARAAR